MIFFRQLFDCIISRVLIPQGFQLTLFLKRKNHVPLTIITNFKRRQSRLPMIFILISKRNPVIWGRYRSIYHRIFRKIFWPSKIWTYRSTKWVISSSRLYIIRNSPSRLIIETESDLAHSNAIYFTMFLLWIRIRRIFHIILNEHVLRLTETKLKSFLTLTIFQVFLKFW